MAMLAERQQGVVSLAQLEALGMTASAHRVTAPRRSGCSTSQPCSAPSGARRSSAPSGGDLDRLEHEDRAD
jgi:hypothetical protein